MLLPQVWERCNRWVEATTTWCETRDRELTRIDLAGYRSGNPESSQHSVNAYLAALEGKQRELYRLRDTVTQAYDELLQQGYTGAQGHRAQQIRDEKDSTLALLKLVEKELDDQTVDWRRELQAIGTPQVEPAKSLPATLLDPLRTLLASLSRPRDGRALTFGLQIPKLRLRRGRRRGTSSKKS